jgi:hypothetical protein
MEDSMKIHDILISGNQDNFGNIEGGIQVTAMNEQGIKARRIHPLHNGEEFFLSNNALETSYWKPLEIGRQLPLGIYT